MKRREIWMNQYLDGSLGTTALKTKGQAQLYSIDKDMPVSQVRFLEVEEFETTMKILLWEHDDCNSALVLWDGISTYWTEHMQPSRGYEDPVFIRMERSEGLGVFTYIGEL